MTGTTRASIFEGDDMDLSAFAPKAAPDQAAPPAAKVKAVAEAANFRSRQAPPAPVKRPDRRRRTGRNVQFNMKASQEVIDRFLVLADQHGWVLGETLEHAVAALERSLATPGERA